MAGAPVEAGGDGISSACGIVDFADTFSSLEPLDRHADPAIWKGRNCSGLRLLHRRRVGGASEILPFQIKCLRPVVTLHQMLHRRRKRGVLALWLTPPDLRDTLDELHAWVEMHGEIVPGNDGKQCRT